MLNKLKNIKRPHYTTKNTMIEIYILHYEQGILNLSPKYQRPYIWTQEQKDKLVWSIFKGIPIPPLILNEFKNKDYTYQFNVIDGKQRLTTILDFYKNKFEVEGTFYKDLPSQWQRKFKTVMLPYIQLQFSSIEEEENYYNIFNFGGTNH